MCSWIFCTWLRGGAGTDPRASRGYLGEVKVKARLTRRCANRKAMMVGLAMGTIRQDTTMKKQTSRPAYGRQSGSIQKG